MVTQTSSVGAARPKRGKSPKVMLTAIVSLALLALLPQQARADSTLDQSNAGSSAVDWSPGAKITFGQTFTPAITGYLTRIDVKVLWSQADSTPTYLRVYNTANTMGVVPNGSPLTSQLVTGMPIDGALQCNSASMTSFPLTSPVYVQAGRTYAFTLEHPSFNTQNYLMACFTGNTYSGGTGLVYDWQDHVLIGWDWFPYTNDTFFSTYVNPASPTGMPPMHQGVPIPASGNCSDVNDAGLDYGTGLKGQWHRAWQSWVKSDAPGVIGGWACARTLVNDGQGWRVQ